MFVFNENENIHRKLMIHVRGNHSKTNPFEKVDNSVLCGGHKEEQFFYYYRKFTMNKVMHKQNGMILNH